MHRPLLAACCLVLPALTTGCRSAYIEADIINASARPVTLVELDYPSASFGTGSLAPGATFHYRFKVLGGGPTRLIWTDATYSEHTISGPSLHEGQQGTLTVVLHDAAVDWQPKLAGGA